MAVAIIQKSGRFLNTKFSVGREKKKTHVLADPIGARVALGNPTGSKSRLVANYCF